MAHNKKEQNIEKGNDERDQDEGNMDNGTIGGDIGIGSSSDVQKQSENSGNPEGGESKTVSVGTEGSAAGK